MNLHLYNAKIYLIIKKLSSLPVEHLCDFIFFAVKTTVTNIFIHMLLHWWRICLYNTFLELVLLNQIFCEFKLWLIFPSHSAYKLYHLTCQPAMDTVSIIPHIHRVFYVESTISLVNICLIKYEYIFHSVKKSFFSLKVANNHIL